MIETIAYLSKGKDGWIGQSTIKLFDSLKSTDGKKSIVSQDLYDSSGNKVGLVKTYVSIETFKTESDRLNSELKSTKKTSSIEIDWLE
jgi:hypothetical protein